MSYVITSINYRILLNGLVWRKLIIEGLHTQTSVVGMDYLEWESDQSGLFRFPRSALLPKGF